MMVKKTLGAWLFFAVLNSSFHVDVVDGQDAQPTRQEIRLISGLIQDPEDFVTSSFEVSLRAVALRMPWVYALDRGGDLYVLESPSNRLGEFGNGLLRVVGSFVQPTIDPPPAIPKTQLRFVDRIENAGDGNAVKIIDNVLVLTREGGLETYSLDQAASPRHLTSVKAQFSFPSHSIVRAGPVVYVLGDGAISCYSVDDVRAVKLIATLRNEVTNWSGCFDGTHLYVTEPGIGRGSRQGIAVYDATNPSLLARRFFVETSRAAYHLFVSAQGNLMACLDSASWFETASSGHVYGSVEVFRVAANGQPNFLAKLPNCGGRSVVMAHDQGRSYLVCNAAVFVSSPHALRPVFSFFPHGTTLDGFPYQGDSDGGYAALATDFDIPIIRIGTSRSGRLGRLTGILLITWGPTCLF